MFTGTVAHIDAHDLILLTIIPNIPIPEITFANPDQGCEYFFWDYRRLTKDCMSTPVLLDAIVFLAVGISSEHLVHPVETLEKHASIKEIHVVFWE